MGDEDRAAGQRDADADALSRQQARQRHATADWQQQPADAAPGDDTVGDDRSGGDELAGDRSGGDRVAGDRPGDDRLGGDTFAGDRPGGDGLGGDRLSGDQSGGDRLADDPSVDAEVADDGPVEQPPVDAASVPLQLEQLILDSGRQYTPFQAARTAGVSMELASRFWRAMGFADIGQSRALTDADVIALRRLAGLVEAGLLSETMAIQVARSTGQTTARLAEWQIDTFLEHLTSASEPGLSRAEVAYPLVELLLPELEQFLVYVWRRQLAAVTGRVVQAAEDVDMQSGRLAVGFADLVGFTRLSRRLEDDELGELVENFEITCADIVAGRGGRLVKTLGDEILYVAEEAATAADIGLALVETLSKDESMPALRVGMAFGAVTTRMGDVFGTTVNLASRLTSIAPKDSVMVDGELAAALERESVVAPAGAGGSLGLPPGAVDALSAVAAVGMGPEDRPEEVDDSALPYRFELRPMWRRPVRGLGLVEPWLLRRRGDRGEDPRG